MSEALAPIQKRDLISGQFLRPSNLTEAMEAAEMIAHSDMVPEDYKGKPGNVLVAMQMGAEVGLAPLQAIQNISVINGRPCIWGDIGLAIVQNAPDFLDKQEHWENEERDEKTHKLSPACKAICVVKRRNRTDAVGTFSLAEAIAAKLYPGKDTSAWAKYPKDMLMWRARWRAMRAQFSDALKGLTSAEEMRDVQVIEVKAEPIPEEGTHSIWEDRKKGDEADESAAPTWEDVERRLLGAKTRDELKSVRADAAKLQLNKRAKAKTLYDKRWAELPEKSEPESAPAHPSPEEPPQDEAPPPDEGRDQGGFGFGGS